MTNELNAGGGDAWAAVIRRAQALDPSAFDALVDEYSPRLYGFLYRLTGRREDSEDLVQEVFVRVVRMIGQYEHDGRFEAWLFRIAANLARDHARKIIRAPGMRSLDSGGGWNPDCATTGGQLADPPDRAAVQAENVDELQRALAKLPEAEREVIMLRHYGHMTFAEIAETMETPIGTALARAHRGLAKLRKSMESAR